MSVDPWKYRAIAAFFSQGHFFSLSYLLFITSRSPLRIFNIIFSLQRPQVKTDVSKFILIDMTIVRFPIKGTKHSIKLISCCSADYNYDLPVRCIMIISSFDLPPTAAVNFPSSFDVLEKKSCSSISKGCLLVLYHWSATLCNRFAPYCDVTLAIFSIKNNFKNLIPQ
jgi:hypothetical protein